MKQAFDMFFGKGGIGVMDWRDVVVLIGAFILIVIVFVKATIEAKDKAKEREIIEIILRQNDEYEKMNEKLKKKIKELQNENKN